jgi:hypothetical protein
MGILQEASSMYEFTDEKEEDESNYIDYSSLADKQPIKTEVAYKSLIRGFRKFYK